MQWGGFTQDDGRDVVFDWNGRKGDFWGRSFVRVRACSRDTSCPAGGRCERSLGEGIPISILSGSKSVPDRLSTAWPGAPGRLARGLARSNEQATETGLQESWASCMFWIQGKTAQLDMSRETQGVIRLTAEPEGWEPGPEGPIRRQPESPFDTWYSKHPDCHLRNITSTLLSRPYPGQSEFTRGMIHANDLDSRGTLHRLFF